MIQTQMSVDAEGNPHTDGQGYAYKEETLDDKGRIVKERTFDVHKRPFCDELGDYGTAFTFGECAEGRIITYISLDALGNPHTNNQGYMSLEKTIDDTNRVVKERIFDARNMPLCDDSGDYGKAYQYIENGRIIIHINLDANGNPHNNNHGYAFDECTLDEKERTIKERKFTVDKIPFCDEFGDYGTSVDYRECDNGLIVTYASLDETGNPHNNNRGYAFLEKMFDERERLLRKRFFDVDLNPIIYNDLGDYGTAWEYSPDETCTLISLDMKGKPHLNNRGYMSEMRFQDPSGKTLSFFYDMDGNLVEPVKEKKGRIAQFLKKCFLKYMLVFYL